MAGEWDDLDDEILGAVSSEETTRAQREAAKWRRRAHEQRARANRAERQLEAAEEALDLSLGIADHEPAPEWPERKPSTGRPNVWACLCLSDWHINESVSLESTNGLNEYSPTIAEQRARRLFEGFAWYCDLLASKQDLAGIWIGINGDMADNEIHVDGARDNALTPMESIEALVDMVCPGFRLLARLFPDIPIEADTMRGNHGRVDRRVPASKVNEYSIEYPAYRWIKRELRGVADVRVGQAGTIYPEINGHTIRMHHGDAFGYSGGVGGIQVPATRWHMRAEQTRRTLFSLVGHWHEYDPGRRVLVNGNLKGYDPFSNFRELGNAAPCQAAFAIDRERGRVFDRPIYVGEHGLR